MTLTLCRLLMLEGVKLFIIFTNRSGQVTKTLSSLRILSRLEATGYVKGYYLFEKGKKNGKRTDCKVFRVSKRL